MDYIDLLDDSDDGFPLLPAKASILPGAVLTKSETIDLLSSDEEVPPSKCSKAADKLSTDKADSDKTEIYGSSTEGYSNSSDAESLPDLDFQDPLSSPTENIHHRNSETDMAASPDPFNDSFDFDIDDGHTSEPACSNDGKSSVGQPYAAKRTSKDEQPFTHIKPASKKTEKVAEREIARQEKKRIQQQKQDEKQKKLLEKQREVAMKNAEREAKRAAKPGECHRHMLLEVDQKLEQTSLGICIEAICTANGVPFTYTTTAVSNTIVYKRKLVSAVAGQTSYVVEDNMAVVLPMMDMVKLVQLNSTSTHTALENYIQDVKEKCNSKPTVIVIGCEKYFSTLKTQSNRAYKDKVLGTHVNSKKNKDVPVITRLDYEQAITCLQMTSNTVVIHHELEEEAAKTIIRLNKAIAEAPVKRGKYEQEAQSVKTCGLKIGRNGGGCRKVWQRMLQEFRNISADVASSIVAEWSSPYLLFKAYQDCDDQEQAEALLQNIQIRRGGGVVQTTRRVGKETSRRICELFTQHADYIIK